jgi:SsrA-binding protein
MHIGVYEQGSIFNHSETRSRKLLLNKKEILTLKTGVERMGNAIVPLKLYFKNNRVKVLIVLAKGKKSFDKRETTKKRDIDREIRRNFKNKV